MLFYKKTSWNLGLQNIFHGLNAYIHISNIYLSIIIIIYIYINLLSTSIHGYQKKRKKNPPGVRNQNISNHRPGEKGKNIIGQKERKGQPRHTSWKKSRYMQSVGQKKNKTHRKRSTATITRVLNTCGANYKINLNHKSQFSY